MEKKIVALGPKTRKSFMVTLPIDWVKAQGLDKSRQADLEIVGNSAVVRPFRKEKSRIILDAKNYQNTLKRVIAILYKRGADEIKIVNADAKVINLASQIAEQRCIGFEIIEQGKDYCLVVDVAKESAENFQDLLRRSFMITIQLAEETDEDSLKNLDKSLNKITAYCQRLLNKQGYSDFQNVNYYSRLCGELERIGDWYMMAHREGQKVSTACRLLLRRTYELFYKFSPKAFDALQSEVPRGAGKTYYEKAIMNEISSVLGIISAIKIQ